MRLHFNLLRGDQRIPDEVGVDVEDLQAGVLEAFETLRAMQERDPEDASSWAGWELQICDGSVRPITSIPLGDGMSFRRH